MKILIVDDVSINLNLLCAQMEQEGHTVVQAHDGVEALQILGHLAVDVVISDILMPRMDGYRLCHQIRKSTRFNALPIIIYTSTYTSPSDEKLAFDVGADKYLKRPVSRQTLAAAVVEVVAKTRPPVELRAEGLGEVEVLNEYSERLVAKLEEKNIALEQANAELVATRSRLQHLLQHSPSALYSLD